MIDLLFQIGISAICSWILFVTVDLFWQLPREGGVSGADAIARAVHRAGGDMRGGTMMGNIVSSPDASAGTLLAACGVYCAGIPGGLLATILVFIGNRICHDPGYAGTSGCFLATFMVYGGMRFLSIAPECFIAGMVIAILTIQGISPRHASRLLGWLWRMRT
jgi:energy-converting hydrogenase A subunit B